MQPMVAKLANSESFRVRRSTLASSWRRRREGAGRCAQVGLRKNHGGTSRRRARMENGWTFSTKTGLYGTDYLQRAFVTAIGLGANRPQDAVYPTSEVDAEGKPYSGANKYVMHFPKGQLPPADGFWSLTMYNGEYFLRRQPAQSLQHQRPSEPQSQRRRFHGSLHSERKSRRGQGIELASCADRQVHPHATPLLAEGEKSFDH